METWPYRKLWNEKLELQKELMSAYEKGLTKNRPHWIKQRAHWNKFKKAVANGEDLIQYYDKK